MRVSQGGQGLIALADLARACMCLRVRVCLWSNFLQQPPNKVKSSCGQKPDHGRGLGRERECSRCNLVAWPQQARARAAGLACVVESPSKSGGWAGRADVRQAPLWALRAALGVGVGWGFGVATRGCVFGEGGRHRLTGRPLPPLRDCLGSRLSSRRGGDTAAAAAADSAAGSAPTAPGSVPSASRLPGSVAATEPRAFGLEIRTSRHRDERAGRRGWWG